MADALDAVKTAAEQLTTDILTAFPSTEFGVGYYRDFRSDRDLPLDSVYNEQLAFGTAAQAQAAIAAWSASGGGDGSEGQFYALTKIAEIAAWDSEKVEFY